MSSLKTFWNKPGRGQVRGFLSLIIILFGIILGVYLTLHPQIFKSGAGNNVTRLEIFGPTVQGGSTTSRNVKLRITYVPNTTPSQSYNLVKTVYAASCNPLGGIDPKTWILIEKYTCDPGNPGTAGEQWACFGSDGKPRAVKFSNDVSDTTRCPISVSVPPPSPASNTCLPGCCGGTNNLCGTCPNGQKCSIQNGACSSGLSCDPNSATSPLACLPGCCGGPDNLCGECPNGQKCTISNGACSSGLSCDPKSGNLSLIAFPISSGKIDYGVQIDVRDSQKIPTAAQANALKIGWVRFAFPCVNSTANNNSCPNDYHKVNLINSVPQNLKILAVITGDTTWNAPIGSLDTSDWRKYTDSVYVPTLRKIVTDYGSRISAVELWNEEDVNAGTSYDPYIPPSAFAYLVSQSAAAVKQINPNIQVITGGLAAGYPFYLGAAIQYQPSAFSQVDAIGIHPYAPPSRIGDVTNSVNNLYSVMQQNSLIKNIWVTEIGIQNFSSVSSPRNQKEFLENALSQLQSIKPTPPLINWYAYVDFMSGADGSSGWGLYDNSGNLKDAGRSYAQIVSSTQSAPAPSASIVYPTAFRVANSQVELGNAPEQVFDTNGKEIDWVLSPGSGAKKVYVQFKILGNWDNNLASASIILAQPQNPPKASVFKVGVNIETAPSYGYGDLRPFSNASDIDSDLKAVSAMKGSLVRVFVANNKIESSEAAKRLGFFLDKASQYNISVIPVLIDFYGSGHNPAGTDKYYTNTFNGISLLNHSFFASGYKSEYFDFVKTVISANKDKSALYAWEIGNELKDDTSPQTFVSFMKDSSLLIRSLDSTHPVATGMIFAGHSGLTADQLYSNLPDIGIITVHPYNGSKDGTDDVSWAKQNGKEALVEEIGFSGSSDRSPLYQTEINYWKDKGATGVLPWGFIAKGLGDNGDGDKSVGFDVLFHSDYDKIFNLLSSYVPSVAPTVQVSINPYDLTGDGKVDSADLAKFISIWIGGGNPKTLDFNNDGVVNAIDFGILLQHMGTTTQ